MSASRNIRSLAPNPLSCRSHTTQHTHKLNGRADVNEGGVEGDKDENENVLPLSHGIHLHSLPTLPIRSPTFSTVRNA